MPLPHDPHVASGFYHITPHSKLALFRNAIDFSSDEFHTMYEFMEHDVDPSPNPRNPSTFLKRKQCTFVTPGTSGYEFGQENQTFRMEVDTWPLAVRRALDKAKQLSNDFFGDTCGTYNGVHANLYRDGSVGVNPHADKEISMLAGAPIFSFTLLSDPALPRPFSIYTQKNEKLYDISLGHGDILVMYGKMQQEFKHGIEAAKPPKMYKSLRRINMTVRAFLPQ
jgi:alkylated DNA repair dioxygenase AlkB